VRKKLTLKKPTMAGTAQNVVNQLKQMVGRKEYIMGNFYKGGA